MSLGCQEETKSNKFKRGGHQGRKEKNGDTVGSPKKTLKNDSTRKRSAPLVLLQDDGKVAKVERKKKRM